jgi:hypothetical protein
LFFTGGLLFFPLWPASDHHPLTYASGIARIIATYHHRWLICWDGVLLTFFQSWPRKSIPIS